MEEFVKYYEAFFVAFLVFVIFITRHLSHFLRFTILFAVLVAWLWFDQPQWFNKFLQQVQVQFANSKVVVVDFIKGLKSNPK